MDNFSNETESERPNSGKSNTTPAHGGNLPFQITKVNWWWLVYSNKLPDTYLQLNASNLSHYMLPHPAGGTVLCQRRSCLPSASPNNSTISLWNILRNNIGKDLSKVAMPVHLNEPLNTLQRHCEELEYSELLDRAADTQDPFERMVRHHNSPFALFFFLSLFLFRSYLLIECSSHQKCHLEWKDFYIMQQFFLFELSTWVRRLNKKIKNGLFKDFRMKGVGEGNEDDIMKVFKGQKSFIQSNPSLI